jgi:hypothetical protein
MSDINEIPTHEAGALIQFSRVTGKANLFGSDFDHDHYITLKVTPCTTQRSSNRTWYMGTLKPYIEVSLSAAQFAEAITTLNCGSGIPCTMEYLSGRGKFPRIEPIPQRPAFEAEGGEALAESIAAIDDAIAELDTLKLSVAAKKAMHGKLTKARMRLSDRLPFIIESFAEAMDDVEQKAKTEIAAYADHVRSQIGGIVLAGGEVEVVRAAVIGGGDHG